MRREKKESMWRITLRRLSKNRTAMTGLIILLVLIVLSIIAPLITPYAYDEMDITAIAQGPSRQHLLGTDKLGQDVFSRILYGGRYSLSLGIIGAMSALAVGIVLGSMAGYFGGWVDNLIMRVCDVLQAIPGMLLSVVVSATLGGGFVNTVIALAIGGIAGSVRLLRGQILSVRNSEYLEAAQSINCSSSRIMFRHILPNVLSPLIVGTTTGIGSTILIAAGLSFIGLGVQPPTPEWGAMLTAGREYITSHPHLVIFPGIAIFIAVLSINLFGDGLRDALDPKLKK